MADPAAPAEVLQAWSEKFLDSETVFFQIISLGQATYVWIGNEEAKLDSLAMGVPSPHGPTGVGTVLLGSGADSASKAMAQRLSKKLGHPVFVAMTLRDDSDLRFFAQRRVIETLQGQAPPPAAPKPAAAASKAEPSASAAAGTQASGSSAMTTNDAGVGTRVHEVFESGEKLGAASARIVVEAAQEAVRARGRFSIALSGGSIPKLLGPALLAARAAARFDAWHVFLADERYVAEEHADSNLGVWRPFLTEAGVPPSQIHGLDSSVPLEQAARAYEAALLSVVGGGDARAGGEPPRIDALLLGMGPDGHTASLFPGHPLVEEGSCWVAPIGDSPKPPPCRITLTLPVLNAARVCVFVVTGASKAPMVRDAFSAEPSVPAGLVLAGVRTHWMLDAPAAAELVEEESKNDHLYG